ncbi:hypothetical protein [Corynebacterium nuruki]|uniref:hypothetical protein n=1 Tax=Corynebacterium nuruki TaxID=1032851 RepID=UPI00024855F1|nr:hypothetical protein [Corynebacterium nuruki]
MAETHDSGPGHPDYGAVVDDYLARAGRITDEFAQALQKQVDAIGDLVKQVKEGNFGDLGELRESGDRSAGAPAADTGQPAPAVRRVREFREPGIFD